MVAILSRPPRFNWISQLNDSFYKSNDNNSNTGNEVSAVMRICNYELIELYQLWKILIKTKNFPLRFRFRNRQITECMVV